VSEAVASDAETAAYVDELEHRVDEIMDDSDLPSGDSLAAELTRFLREREEDDDGSDAAARRALSARRGCGPPASSEFLPSGFLRRCSSRSWSS